MNVQFRNLHLQANNISCRYNFHTNQSFVESLLRSDQIQTLAFLHFAYHYHVLENTDSHLAMCLKYAAFVR